MLRLAADENFNHDIISGLLKRNPEVDIIRVQDAGLAGADDPAVLAWAAAENRVLLTHDVHTMTRHAYDRVQAGKPMPGGIRGQPQNSTRYVIDNLLLIVECSLENEWEGQVRYLPL